MRAPRGTEEIKALAEQLIEAAGSKREAHRAIDTAKTKAKGGRSPGHMAYRQVDSQLLALVKSLQGPWVIAHRRGERRPLPNRRALIGKIVALCWDDCGVNRKRGRKGCWDTEVCGLLGLPASLGTSPAAVVKRVDGRRALPMPGLEEFDRHRDPRDFVLGSVRDPLLASLIASRKPDDKIVWNSPPLGLWEELARRRPEIDLLPDLVVTDVEKNCRAF